MSSGENTTPVPHEAHRRSLIKAITWRITGTIDTFIISWIVTGEPKVALTISAIEVFSKVALYYGHERLWHKIQWGRKD